MLIQSLHRTLVGMTGPASGRSIVRLHHDEETADALYQSIAAYNHFAKDFFCDLKPPERTIAQRDLKLSDGSTLRLSGFNSSFVSSAFDLEKDKNLFVDPACFQLTHEAGVEHVVLCHHPYSWLRQGRVLEDHLHSVARLHLFGHEHVNRVSVGQDWLQLAASATQPDKEEPDWEPGYNLIEIDVRSMGGERHLDVAAHVRKWQFRPGQFVPKFNRDVDAFRQSIKLAPWIAPIGVGATADEDVIQLPVCGKADPASMAPSNPARALSIRFFKLTISQRSAIAGQLDLLKDEDANEPDFERFRRVFLRAQAGAMLSDIERAVIEAERKNQD